MVLTNTPLPTVFEISDIDIPNEIDESYLESLDFHHHFSIKNNLREIYYMPEQEENQYKPLVNELGVKFKEKLSELKDSDFEHWWPVDMYKYLDLTFDSKLVGTSLLKDSPKFDMGSHVDNGLCIASAVINIIDQDSHTVYYKDSSSNQIIYSGPSSRGTGIIHLNHPGLWHTGINNASSDRYVYKVYYGLNYIEEEYSGIE